MLAKSDDPTSPSSESKYSEVQLRPHTYWELNEKTMLFEEFDPVTGAIVSIAGDLAFRSRRAEFVETEIDGQKVMVQTGVAYAHLDGLRRPFPYSEAIADVICQKVMAGHAFTKIPEITGMPDRYALNRWLREEKDFAEKVRQARKIRAEHLRDQAVKIGVESVGVDKNEVPGRKLATDVLRWAASCDDPETYGNRVKVEGGVTVEMLLETGIRRSGDAGVPILTVDSKKINPPEEPVEDGEYTVPPADRETCDPEDLPDEISSIKPGDDEPS